MPGGDRTGPLGQGPMTGRGAGYGGGFGMPGYMNPPGFGGQFYGRGFGFGRGRGRGFGRRMIGPFYPYHPYAAPYSEKDEADMLRQEAQHLETALEDIQKRLTQLEGQTQKQKEGK